MQLITYLEENKISQRSFAKMIGVQPLAVNRYIKGKRTPKPEILLRIEHATEGKVTIRDFAA